MARGCDRATTDARINQVNTLIGVTLYNTGPPRDLNHHNPYASAPSARAMSSELTTSTDGVGLGQLG